MLTVKEMHQNAVQPNAQSYRLWAQGKHMTPGNQIHFANTPQWWVLAPLLFYSPSPGCFRCGSALQTHQECLYSKLNTGNNPDTQWLLLAYGTKSDLAGILHNDKHS